MASLDSDELMSLFHNVSQTMETFSDKQLVFMNDTSQTTPQQLVFDNISLMSRASIWKTSFIRVPVLFQASRLSTLQSITTFGTTTSFNTEPYQPGVTPIALKCGGPSLFYGIQLNLSTGTGIINDQNSQFIRPMLQCKFEANEEGASFYGIESGFQPDFFPEVSSFIGSSKFLSPYPSNGTTANTTGNHLAPGNGLAGAIVNGLTQVIPQNPATSNGLSSYDYAVVQSGLFNQAYEFIQNPVSVVAISATPSVGAHIFSGVVVAGPPSGILQSSPASQLYTSSILGTVFGLVGGAQSTYSVVVNSENFSFSSNALVGFQQPMVLTLTMNTAGTAFVAPVVAPLSILLSAGSGYGTDGTAPLVTALAGAAQIQLLPNLIQMTLKSGALMTCLTNPPASQLIGDTYALPAWLTAVGAAQATLVAQVAYSIPGLAPFGVEGEFKGGFANTTCRNPFYNRGFKERIRAFWSNTEVVTAATANSNAIYRSNVIVRVQDLHDVFRQMDFPTENTRFQLYLSLAAPINLGVSQQYFGMQYGYGALYNPPIMAIGLGSNIAGGALVNGVQQSACTMYFNAVSFHADTATRLADALSNPRGGLIKQLTFIETELQPVALYSPLSANSVTSAVGTISAQIQTTSTRVKRIHFFGLPVGSIAAWGAGIGLGLALPSQSTGLSSQTQSMAQPFSGFIGSAKFANIQLRINGLPWRQNPLLQDWELWPKLREHLPGFGEDDNVGSKWDYAQFQLGFATVYTFDLTRQGVRPSINDPILIGVDITRVLDLNGAGFTQSYSPCDIWCLIEKESNVQLNIGSGSAAATKQY